MNLINFCSKTIKYSFYSLFFLVPLVFAGNTSELFEFNKMWLAFILTLLIATAWMTKMILERKISIQRTPLDIPLLLFLLSQIISTIFSLDQHISWWGYYSRFNGGLLSTICYLFLYYAFVSNLELKHVFRTLFITLIGGLIVVLWGFPSHYGYDPTCLMFRGTLDTLCWTEAFRPTIRVFSTLGQPAWLAAYLAALIPLVTAYALARFHGKENEWKNELKNWKFYFYLFLIVLFYINLIFTNTRAGLLAYGVANILFWSILFIKKIFTTKVFIRYFLLFHAVLFVCNFFFNIPVEGLNKLTLENIRVHMTAAKPTPAQLAPMTPTQQPATQATQTTPTAESSITDSGKIRVYVWKGAIDAWKANALFGTGVETFAFAYYKFRPIEHNLTSEWDYLYNKAHNEYLNYLTTTGLFGLGTYLAFIALFSFFIVKRQLYRSVATLFKKTNHAMEKTTNAETELLIIGLFTGWVSILVSNFFGFSVVIMNLFLFLIPAFVFILDGQLNPEKKWKMSLGSPSHGTSPYQWTMIVLSCLLAGYFIISLSRYWYADTKYALGYNLDRAGKYQDAYPLLLEAVKIKPNEPVYKDELAINVGVLSTALAMQKDAANSAQFANNAIEMNNQVITAHPNNVIYWKNRVRIFYTLAQADPSQQATYYQEALKAIQKAHTLAPTDAKIEYNLGVLYGQTGNIPQGIDMLQDTIRIKPDYRDPYYALGLFLHQLAVDQNDRVIHPELQEKAIETYKYVLEHIDPADKEIKDALTSWGVTTK